MHLDIYALMFLSSFSLYSVLYIVKEVVYTSCLLCSQINITFHCSYMLSCGKVILYFDVTADAPGVLMLCFVRESGSATDSDSESGSDSSSDNESLDTEGKEQKRKGLSQKNGIVYCLCAFTYLSIYIKPFDV